MDSNYTNYISENKTFDEYKKEKCTYNYYLTDLFLRNKVYYNCMTFREKYEKTEYEKQVNEYNEQKKDIQNIFNTINNDDLSKFIINGDNTNIHKKFDDYIDKYNFQSKNTCYNIIPNTSQKILDQFNSKNIYICINKNYSGKSIARIEIKKTI